MTVDKPDTSMLEREIERIKESLVRCQQNKDDDMLRDGLVMRFKWTYGLSHELLKRYLKYDSRNTSEINKMTFQDIIRTACDQNLLLGDWSNWSDFRDMRVRSDHTYDDGIAIKVAAGIPRFIEEATYLLEKIQERLGCSHSR